MIHTMFYGEARGEGGKYILAYNHYKEHLFFEVEK
jgi:hypothetical protein